MATEYDEMNPAELQQALYELRKQGFELRRQRAVGQSPKNHLFKQVRRNIARIKTLLNRFVENKGVAV